MKGTVRGFLLTSGTWVAFAAMYSLIELARGHVPFEMFRWETGGKFVTITVLLVVGIGTAIGYASDQIRAKLGR